MGYHGGVRPTAHSWLSHGLLAKVRDKLAAHQLHSSNQSAPEWQINWKSDSVMTNLLKMSFLEWQLSQRRLQILLRGKYFWGASYRATTSRWNLESGPCIYFSRKNTNDSIFLTCMPTLLFTFRAAWNSSQCLISDSRMPSPLLRDTTLQWHIEFGVCTVRDS